MLRCELCNEDATHGIHDDSGTPYCNACVEKYNVQPCRWCDLLFEEARLKEHCGKLLCEKCITDLSHG